MVLLGVGLLLRDCGLLVMIVCFWFLILVVVGYLLLNLFE